MLELFGVRKSFGRDSLALWDVTFRVRSGQCVLITGPAGSGKTTLLRIIAGQTAPEEGQVIVDGVNITSVSRRRQEWLLARIGLVPSRPVIVKAATVGYTLMLALGARGVFADQALRLAHKLLVSVNLVHKEKTRADLLNDAEKQRLSIARALAHQPKMLLVDDPLVAIDNDDALEIIRILNRTAEEGIAVILTTRRKEALRVPASWLRLSLLAGRVDTTAKRLNSQEDE